MMIEGKSGTINQPRWSCQRDAGGIAEGGAQLGMERSPIVAIEMEVPPASLQSVMYTYERLNVAHCVGVEDYLESTGSGLNAIEREMKKIDRESQILQQLDGDDPPRGVECIAMPPAKCSTIMESARACTVRK